MKYTLAPAVEYIWWHEGLPIEEGVLYGARAGADFGRLVGVNGWYHRRNDLAVRLSETPLRANGVPLADQMTDVITFGANLAIKLGTGSLVPFVQGGAGVIRFDPSGSSPVEQVNYRYGGGFQYDPSPNVRAIVTIEDSRFRLAPEALSPEVPDEPSADARTARSNWTLSASLGFSLGGPLSRDGAGADEWSFASIPIEPFVGRLDFEDPNLARQTLAGVRAGVDFGPYIGLRGFYWQGRTDGLGERQPIQGYGAEAQFNLNAGVGPAPYLVAGGGRIEYDDDFRDLLDAPREDETVLIVGGGVGLRLSDHFRLNVAARNYIRSGVDFDDVASTDQLSHNWLLSAGLGFNLGRGRDDPGREQPSRRDAMAATPDSVLPEPPRRPARVPAPPPAGQVTVPADSTTPRMITLPVPVTGEVIIRYGAVAPAAHHEMRHDSMPPVAPGAGMTAADREWLLRRLTAHLDSLLADRLDQAARGAPPAPVVVVPPAMPPPAPETTRTPRPPARAAEPEPAEPRQAAREEAPDRSAGLQLRGVSPYVAGFDAFTIGVMLDAGSLFGLESLRLVPELAVAPGDDASLLLALAGEYLLPILRLGDATRARPHVRLGLGGLAQGGDADSRFGVNVAYGLTLEPAQGSSGLASMRLFLEHQGIDFFATNRLAAGLRWVF